MAALLPKMFGQSYELRLHESTARLERELQAGSYLKAVLAP
jgi:hypothetical protein